MAHLTEKPLLVGIIADSYDNVPPLLIHHSTGTAADLNCRALFLVCLDPLDRAMHKSNSEEAATMPVGKTLSVYQA